MDLRDQLDRAVGEPPTANAPVEPLVRAGRRVVRRRRAVGAVGVLAVLTVAGIGGSRLLGDTPPVPAGSSVEVRTCAGTPRLPGVEVAGAGSLCLAPGRDVVDRVDTPVADRPSVALTVAAPDGNRQNVLVVFGDHGLPATMALPRFGDDGPQVAPLAQWLEEVLAARDEQGWAEQDPVVDVPPSAGCPDLSERSGHGRRRGALVWWTGAGRLCVNPEWRVVEQIDDPVRGAASRAFGLVDVRGRYAQVIIVRGEGQRGQGGLEARPTHAADLSDFVRRQIAVNPGWTPGPGLDLGEEVGR